MEIPGYGLIVAGIALFNGIYVVAQVLAGKLVGVRPTVLTFGFGPQLLQFQLAAVAVRVRLLPFAASVQYGAEGDPQGLSMAPWYKKAFIPAFGLLGCFAAVALFLGGQAWQQTAGTWPQILDVFRNWREPLGLADVTASLTREVSVVASLAIIGAKIVGFNALPVPFFNGGQFVLALIEGAFGRHALARMLPTLYKFGLVFMALFLLLVLVREFIL